MTPRGSGQSHLYEFGGADPNCDAQVDLSDYSALPACLTGSGGLPIPVTCHPFDFNADEAGDLSDVAGFQRTMGN